MFPPHILDARRTCLYVTVTSPFNSRNNFDNSHLLRAEVEKGRKYLEKCSRLNLHFTPFALDCFGRLVPAAITVVDILASVTANHKNISVAAARSEIINKVCFTTMKFTAAAILDRQLPGQLV
jgi:hypothetical protein